MNEITEGLKSLLIEVQMDPIYIWAGLREVEDYANRDG